MLLWAASKQIKFVENFFEIFQLFPQKTESDCEWETSLVEVYSWSKGKGTAKFFCWNEKGEKGRLWKWTGTNREIQKGRFFALPGNVKYFLDSACSSWSGNKGGNETGQSESGYRPCGSFVWFLTVFACWVSFNLKIIILSNVFFVSFSRDHKDTDKLSAQVPQTVAEKTVKAVPRTVARQSFQLHLTEDRQRDELVCVLFGFSRPIVSSA